MGYVAVKGGEKAIESALKLIELFRKENRLAVDQVMGEGSLYAPDLAEMAIKQAEGDLIEASFLIRAYRSTLPRIGFSEPIDTREMFLVRRISSAFREIPGGQILGPTRDYTQRLLDFDASPELNCLDEFSGLDGIETEGADEEKAGASPKAEKVSDLLRKEDLLDAPAESNADPFDITRDDLLFPLPRSGRLQALARGESGAMLALAYSSLRGYGSVHPTLAELRAGLVQLKIRHPHTGEDVSIGEIFLTECEGILHSGIGGIEFEEGDGEGEANAKAEDFEGDCKFSLGYGLVFGQNERKAISMAILDGTTSVKDPKAPAEDQEFVLYHIDGVDAQGFIEHLKLPHYVTFQSSLDRAKRARGESD